MLLAVELTTPSLAAIDRLLEAGAHGVPDEAVPHPFWLARVNVSWPSTPELTVTLAVAVLELPCESVTVSIALYGPGLTYRWLVVAPVCGPTTGEPSPKLNV